MERHFDKKQYDKPIKQFITQISLSNPIKDEDQTDN